MTAERARPLSPEPFAPWAMPVPGAPRMSVDELTGIADNEWQYELIYGRLVRRPLSGGEASKIALRLGGRLLAYVEERQLGEVTGADGGYDLGPAGFPDTELGPDVAFVRREKVPPHDSPAYSKAWPVASDLAVEVASPNQYRPETAAKARLYLAASTRLVWVVWPRPSGRSLARRRRRVVGNPRPGRVAGRRGSGARLQLSRRRPLPLTRPRCWGP